MKLQQRTTIIIVIVFVALGALVYLLEVRGGQEAPQAEGRVPIFSFALNDVVVLEVTDRVSDERMVVRREAGEPWLMLEPFESEADEARIEGLLDRLSTLQSSRVIEEDQTDLEAFGLSEPSLEVKVGLREGASQVLLVGDETPAGYSHYVRLEGQDSAYLVGSSTISDLQRLINEPPEKPTPVPTATLLPTVTITTPTPSVSGGQTVTPTVSAHATGTPED